MSQEHNTTLYFKQGSADKVYKVALIRYIKDADNCGWVVNFAYGRRGKALKCGTKNPLPISYEKALLIYTKLIAAKEAKGYTCGANIAASKINPDIGDRTTWLPQLLNEVNLEEALDAYRTWESTYVQIKHDGERRGILIGKDEIIPANRRGLRTNVAQKIQTTLENIWGKHLFNDVDMGVLDCEDMGDHLVIFDYLMPDDKGLYGPFWYRVKQNLEILETILHTRKLDTLLRIDMPTLIKSEEHLLEFIATARTNNKEGIVLRDGDSYYVPGKPNSGGTALKLKFWASATVIVDKVHPTKRSVSMYVKPSGGRWRVIVGNCTIPTNHAMPGPQDLIEVKYLYAYPGGSLYQPVYKGLRTDLTHKAATKTQLKYKEVT